MTLIERLIKHCERKNYSTGFFEAYKAYYDAERRDSSNGYPVTIAAVDDARWCMFMMYWPQIAFYALVGRE